MSNIKGAIPITIQTQLTAIMQINGKSELLSFIKKELSEKQVYLINVRKIGYSKYILEFEQV